MEAEGRMEARTQWEEELGKKEELSHGDSDKTNVQERNTHKRNTHKRNTYKVCKKKEAMTKQFGGGGRRLRFIADFLHHLRKAAVR